jgi:hypothetical protein
VRLLLPLAAVLALAAGCGGGGDDRLTKEEFQQRANRICTELEEALDAMGEADDSEQLQDQLEASEREFEDALQELRALAPPEEYEQDYEQFLRSGDELKQVIADLSRAAADEDVAALEEISERGDRIDTEADEAAARIGLDDCADD